LDAHQDRHVLKRSVCAPCVLRRFETVTHKKYPIAARDPIGKSSHVTIMRQLHYEEYRFLHSWLCTFSAPHSWNRLLASHEILTDILRRR